MKKLIFALFLTLSALASPSFASSTAKAAYQQKKEVPVYVTKTGSKYHLDGCSYLRSKISISKKDAIKNGYTACSRCKP
jgi:hypothetical protein